MRGGLGFLKEAKVQDPPLEGGLGFAEKAKVPPPPLEGGSWVFGEPKVQGVGYP